MHPIVEEAKALGLKLTGWHPLASKSADTTTYVLCRYCENAESLSIMRHPRKHTYSLFTEIGHCGEDYTLTQALDAADSLSELRGGWAPPAINLEEIRKVEEKKPNLIIQLGRPIDHQDLSAISRAGCWIYDSYTVIVPASVDKKRLAGQVRDSRLIGGLS